MKFQLFSITVVLCLSLNFSSRIILAENYVPSEQILLNCGSPSPKSADNDGREWVSDISSKFALPSTESSTTTATAISQPSSASPIPLLTARIFHSEFTYSFPVIPGRKFIRLYFYPKTSYKGLNLCTSNAIFSVSTNKYTLLNNFSPYRTVRALDSDHVMKEFSVNVASKALNLTFKPLSSSLDSDLFAFVNGIEIVSMPYIYDELGWGAPIVGQRSTFVVDNRTALETMYRVNVGGNALPPRKDTGLYRSWGRDSEYIFGAGYGVFIAKLRGFPNVTYPKSMPSYIAPVEVYSTARTMGPDPRINLNWNLTWTFGVDTGFVYLVRLHFCEFSEYITKMNQRVFNIYLNNVTAMSEFDVITMAGGNGTPMYKDFVVIVPRRESKLVKQDLWLQLHPDPRNRPEYYDALLNGIEIFKMNDSFGNFAGLDSGLFDLRGDGSVDMMCSMNRKTGIGGTVVKGFAGVVVVGFLIFTVYIRRRFSYGSASKDGQYWWLPLSLRGRLSNQEVYKSVSYQDGLSKV